MKTKHGIVAIIDALGTKTASIESATRYIEAIERIKSSIAMSHKTILEDEAYQEAKEYITNLKPRFFGDSIILTLEFERGKQERLCLEAFSIVIAFIIYQGVDEKVLFRGALAVGEYLESAEAALGPAVYDAASWYEKLDLVGVIATPKTRFVIDRILAESEAAQIKVETFEALWPEYRAPIKSGFIDSRLLFWPLFYRAGAKSKAEALLEFRKAFAEFEQPAGTEHKYLNTKSLIEALTKEI